MSRTNDRDRDQLLWLLALLFIGAVTKPPEKPVAPPKGGGGGFGGGGASGSW